MDVTHGFELLREQDIPEINTKARLYRHVKTGAQLLSLINDDENKVFGIAFTTPPYDSTGLPHILEHSVLCGSRNYPLKEPFIELAKGSLNTFLNAFTYPDRTVYPVASQNVKDFYNLIDVYLDAVFYPLLTRWTLMQEGWHYELEDKSQPLQFRGVVFNEMKGAYSSPENVLGRTIQMTLLPDTPYGVDSGGDPAEIPNLTYEAFLAFHRKYYHPSNARILFYGDDDPEERLRYMNKWLSAFDAAPVEVHIPTQPRFTQPRRIIERYDAGEDESSKRAMVSVNWLLTEPSDPELLLRLHVLAHMLIGTPASPLRKALIDSGLGENLTPSGIDDDVREAFFSVGLKGVDPANVDKVEALILDTLRDLAAHGFDPEQVEASLNTIEFRLREANFGSFPRGIAYLTAALRTWTYGGDPLAMLAFEAPLNALKQKLDACGQSIFTDLIQRFFLENPHRTTVILLPDPNVRAEREAAERARLDAARAAMSEADLKRIIEETRLLKERQLTPDPPEVLARLPSLKISDLDPKIRTIPTAAETHDGVTVLHHDLFTNGIVYLDLAFDMRAVPPEDVPYLALIGRALLQMGTEKEDFVKLLQRIGRKTGGIAYATLNTLARPTRTPVARFVLRGKSTVAQFDDMLDILRDVLLTAQLDNRERFKQIVLENKASLESALTPSGHAFVASRLRAAFNPADWVNEQIGGVSQLFFLRDLAERIERDWDAVLAKLNAVRAALVTRVGLVANVTLDAHNWEKLQPKLMQFLATLPASPQTPCVWSAQHREGDEGLSIPAQVNYVGKGADLYALGFQLSGRWLPVHNWLRTGYLWERVRMQGGAYGAFCTFDPRSGVFAFLSYRDPNLLETLKTYDAVGDYLRGHAPDEQEVTRTIIGVIGDLDAYMLPDAKGYTAMVRWLTGETDEFRQRLRDEVLSTAREDFVRFAEVADALRAHGRVVVMGSAQALTSAAQAHPLQITTVM
ncbi:MAG: insulinase family protein [Thermoflexales bacterium]|nr:insulinase family protein [Thermoflexales bacterium]MCS7324748.1 insulinase family protein [Thermoflexales bacterium]MDW8053072.1 insulinase family protein [Anaerolineae bacterium]MDW8291725.1 insulinase family protein [Anaerolineae bacterium]